MKVKYFVYILKSIASSQVYTGFTTDLENRVRQHNEGIGGYTKGRGPWELVWYSVFGDRQLAESFEKYLKGGSGIAFARKRFLSSMEDLSSVARSAKEEGKWKS